MANAFVKAFQQPAFVPYVNFNQRIRLSYPTDWMTRDQSSPAGFLVFFASPREDMSDHFSENLTIFIESVPPELTVDQYAHACFQNMAQQPVQFVENGKATIAGRLAYRWVFIGPLQGPVPMSAKYLQYIVVANSKGYVVTYTAELEKYEKFLPIIEQMLNSLEIK